MDSETATPLAVTDAGSFSPVKTKAEAQAYLRIGKNKLEALVREGQLPTCSHSGRTLFLKSELDEFLRNSSGFHRAMLPEPPKRPVSAEQRVRQAAAAKKRARRARRSV